MNVKIKNKISSIFRKCRDNKSGFSLVELIICGIILGTVTMTVCMMMNSGTNMYVRLNRQQNLMYKSQVTQAQIKEFFIDCDGVCATATADGGNKLFVASYSGDELTLNAFHYVPDDETIYLYQYDQSKLNSGDVDAAAPTQGVPFAVNVSSFDFTIVPGEPGTSSEIVFNFTYTQKKATYDKQIIISMKNNPVYVVTQATGETIESTLFKTVGGVL